MYSGPLVPQALSAKQTASSSSVFLVSFCISSDTVKFFNKTVSYGENTSGILSFFITIYFLYQFLDGD